MRRHAQAAVTRHYMSYSIFGHVFSASLFGLGCNWAPFEKCSDAPCASTLSITDKNGDRLRGASDRLEPKPVDGIGGNVNYHVWPDDK